MDKRPNLDSRISAKDFTEFYWLKKELEAFCRKLGLKTTGSKLEITELIKNYLTTGNRSLAKPISKPTSKSKFSWKNDQLSPETEITDNYKNTENVRIFFEEQIGKHFKFNVQFMNWMKSNNGKTLRGAIKEWERIEAKNKTRTHPKEIAQQFEYNKFMRDFSADNPNAERGLAVKLWKLKRAMRGDNTYNRADLKLINEDENKRTNTTNDNSIL